MLSKEKKGRSENELLVCSVPSCASHLLCEVELGEGLFAFKLVGKKKICLQMYLPVFAKSGFFGEEFRR